MTRLTTLLLLLLLSPFMIAEAKHNEAKKHSVFKDNYTHISIPLSKEEYSIWHANNCNYSDFQSLVSVPRKKHHEPIPKRKATPANEDPKEDKINKVANAIAPFVEFFIYFLREKNK